jgi:hypothetical protein
MILKEVTVTEALSFLSAFALMISLINQTYFYYRLDAMWVMSLLSPTIYLFDIFNIISILLILISIMALLNFIYKKIISKNIYKKRIIFRQGDDLSKLLNENRKKYERNFIIFIMLILMILITCASYMGFKASIYFFGISGVLLGISIVLVMDNSISRRIRLFVSAFLLIIASILHGEYRYINFQDAPNVGIKHEKNTSTNYKLLGIGKDKAILSISDGDSNHSFKIIDLNQIDKIE